MRQISPPKSSCCCCCGSYIYMHTCMCVCVYVCRSSNDVPSSHQDRCLGEPRPGYRIWLCWTRLPTWLSAKNPSRPVPFPLHTHTYAYQQGLWTHLTSNDLWTSTFCCYSNSCLSDIYRFVGSSFPALSQEISQCSTIVIKKYKVSNYTRWQRSVCPAQESAQVRAPKQKGQLLLYPVAGHANKFSKNE